jgi:hypothetical protein
MVKILTMSKFITNSIEQRFTRESKGGNFG